MRFFILIVLTFLVFSFTACFTELTEEEVIVVADEPAADPPVSDVGNFITDVGAFEINHAYIVSQPTGTGGEEAHHLILTKDEAAQNGQLVGTTTVFAVTLTGPAGQLAGTYDTDAAADPERRGLGVRIYQRLNFEQRNNNWLRTYDSGRVEIREVDGDYELVLDFARWGTSLHGTLTTKLVPITLPELREPPTAAEFQGPNHFTRGDESIALNHAYYVKGAPGQSGIIEYSLYLTEEEITAADELSGVSTTMVFATRGNILSRPASFVTGERTYDYLSFLRPRVSQSLFCTNYNFSTRDFDTDEPTDGETRVFWEGEELMVSFQGIISGSTTVAEGLYRGPVTILD